MIKKIKALRQKKAEKLPTRITNDTVAEHRERVLAGGRRLKYPHQYSKHALVRNTIIISLAALLLFAALVWVQLYYWNSTSEWAYRLTQVAPLPVAKIDGEYAKYSDYLLYHRSTVAVLENQGRSGDDLSSDRMKFQRDQAMDRALEDAYARKLAKENNVELVSNETANQHIEQKRKESGLPQSSYLAAVNDHFGWDSDELRIAMKNTILRQEVAYAVDKPAKDLADRIDSKISSGVELKAISEEFGSAVEFQEAIVVPKDNSDGGLSATAASLEVGKTSGAIKALSAGDGYYFITRQPSDATMVSYSFIRVPLTVFKKGFENAKTNGSAQIFIDIK